LTPAFTKANGDRREPRIEGTLGNQLTHDDAGTNKTSRSSVNTVEIGRLIEHGNIFKKTSTYERCSN